MSEDVGAIAASSSSRLNHKSKREAAVSNLAHRRAYRSTCGYCKATSRTSVAQSLWAYTLRVHDYQGSFKNPDHDSLFLFLGFTQLV
jgi:hypothetical protein